ncbi:hypothetical protein NEOLI_004970 [Neolecta irregularis DAH-3]|uniref:CENP-V/GFA domain-containing protein n=1 Tax=Neolecta irregularis (strain DAH-3) TaxID=1198029 RepID=A0A1U7LLB5_NEOID|nr:hypothetical protein NEOLI_004970 [Neolecta irregularis DAH-3]|eukprot:OLL23447.1 hypothetical protein NEOLI_004970 [Neolecta irregularis DAH-3]
MTVTGTCLCGDVKITIPSMPAGSILCHCTHCQIAHGSAFSSNIVVSSDQVIVEGLTKTYIDTGTVSGQGNPRTFCQKCGTIVFSCPAPFKGNHIIKAGIFKDKAPCPVKEIMTCNRLSYIKPIVGAEQVEVM